MEAIMALPNKTGSQEVIDFIDYLETKPAGGILGNVNRATNNKFFSSFVISFSGILAESNPALS